MKASEREEKERRLDAASLNALRAIYDELRHGHDKQDAQTDAIKAMTTALERLVRSLPDK